MWLYQNTIDQMFSVIKKQHLLPPSISWCSRDQLNELWAENMWKRDNYYKLLKDDSLDFDTEQSIINKIQCIEDELDNIDYEWSRFR